MKKRRLLPRYVIKQYSQLRNFALEQRYLPRWVVLGIDLSLCFLAFVITIVILLDSPFSFYNVLTIPQRGLLLIVLHGLGFALFRSYSGIIRHSTFTDVYRLALATGFTVVLAVSISYLHQVIFGEKIYLTTGLVLYAFFSLTILVAFRIVVKEAYRLIKQTAYNRLKKRVAVLGVDDKCIALTQSLMADSSSVYRPVTFMSLTKRFSNHKLLGLPVFNATDDLNNDLKNLKDRFDIDGILIAGDLLSVPMKNEIVESVFEQGMEVYNASLPEQWHSRSDVHLKIAPLQIEDLLERNEIEIDTKLISEDLNGKIILVTGGAGSIGSELVRQIAEFKPKKLIVLDNAESSLNNVDLYLSKKFPNLNYQTYLADITKEGRMEGIFAKFNFDLVYHAAAYKHVPMIERHPREGIRTNTLGTRILADLAVKHSCERFVMISTDKAVNPSNVMGATKRAAEMYVQSLQNKPGVTTKFITTRTGNVLGSNGSVIPFFKEQIKNGGPVTVTHKDIIRYFMTIREACELVLQAGTMGKGGEIFVFDMGKPVRILDMAERMIKLCGLRPYEDIPIEITGLREGEKLYEELLNDGETTLPTYHPKIMVSSVVKHDCDKLCRALDELELMVNTIGKKKVIIKKLKQLVPEYVSQNSVYEELDNKKVEQTKIFVDK